MVPCFEICLVNRVFAVEEYERSWEQNEELGLNDIDTSSADAAYDLARVTEKEETKAE